MHSTVHENRVYPVFNSRIVLSYRGDMGRRARGSYSVGIERRTRIVEAAAGRFSAEGYHATTMTSIAADAGISDSGLLHHFPTKKHLLLAVAQYRLDTSAEWWDTLPAEASGLATLDAMVDAARRLVGQPGLIELFVLVSAEAADPSSPAHTVFAQRYDGAVEALADRLRQGVHRDGLPASLDYPALARECIAVSDGLQLQWVLSDGAVDIVEGVRGHAARLTAALTGATEGESGSSVPVAEAATVPDRQ